MKCLRCAKDTEDRNVFCQECLDEMNKYPVKPGTVVQLPHRQDKETPRRKKEPTTEEQLEAAAKKLDILHRWLLIMTTAAVLLGILLYVSVVLGTKPVQEQPNGRNYTVVQADV